ncbi:hypothetical protein BLA29_006876 [Euroglyphus maynei]|uniref:BTB domain-containing protein n=1 Tax=Euroglyphus maynei TaxID=6958 RepID=A0A1Y3BAP0_EURMA|nr:hypothetical protein BLA29_006876 [Euroglyphus maynei]
MIMIEPPPSIDNMISYHQQTIGLLKINFDDYEDQYKAIGQLRKHDETIDLILWTIDGGHEPVHQYFLAWRAPKFWQRLIEQQQQCMNLQSTIIINDESAENKFPNIRRLFVPKEFIGETILLPILIDSMYRIESNNNDNNQQLFDYRMAWKLLKIADEFQLDFLLRDCIQYFHCRIGLSNCIDLWKVGLKFYQHSYGQQLAKCSYRFLLINLVKRKNKFDKWFPSE